MIETLSNTPSNIAAFRAVGEITADDYKNVVKPKVEQLIKKTQQLNFLLVLDTAVSNFTPGAWFQDAMLGLSKLMRWNRGAIVSDSDFVNKFTDAFSVIAPGEFKGFKKSQLQEAIDWTSERN
jgi:hypothetical protein